MKNVEIKNNEDKNKYEDKNKNENGSEDSEGKKKEYKYFDDNNDDLML